jgi:hypothetical protein
LSLNASFQSFFPGTMPIREFEIIHKQMYNIINIGRNNENLSSFELWEYICYLFICLFIHSFIRLLQVKHLDKSSRS